MSSNKMSCERYLMNTNDTNKYSTKKSRKGYHAILSGTTPSNSYRMHQLPYPDDSYPSPKQNKPK